MFVAKYFVKNKFNSITQSTRQTVSGNDQQGDPDLDERGGVKWYEYNFPPYLNLIHYNPWHGDNIPLACKKTASVVYFGYRTSVFALLVNVGTNIALVALGYAPGIAGEIRREGQYYYALETILCIIYIVFISVDSNNIHGFSAFGNHSASSSSNSTSPVTPDDQPLPSGTGQGALYDIFALSEGSLWSLTLLFSLGGLWRVYRYPGHDIAFRREQPVTAKVRHKKGRASALTAEL